MATRSFICKLLPDNSVTGVYCHYDGYPDGVGKTLKEHYTDPKTVDGLLALGSISELNENLTETVAYHRDRGEDLAPNRVYPSVIDAVALSPQDLGAEYVYVFGPQGWAAFETVFGPQGWAAFETKK